MQLYALYTFAAASPLGIVFLAFLIFIKKSCLCSCGSLRKVDSGQSSYAVFFSYWAWGGKGLI